MSNEAADSPAARSDSATERHHGAQLPLEAGADVLVEMQGLGKRFRTRLVGGDRERYVLLTLPMRRHVAESLLPGAVVIVRYMVSQGRICGFQTEVKQFITKPYPLLFLNFPETFEVLRLRKASRASAFQPTTLRHGESSRRAVIVNISTGGCMVRLDAAEAESAALPQLGAPCTVMVHLHDDAPKAEVPCEVKKVDIDGGDVVMGLAFTKLPEPVEAAIEEYVHGVLEFMEEGVCSMVSP